MKRFIYLLVWSVFLNSCSLDDGVDCALFDSTPQLFSIELVNTEGNNLIENGTFNAEDIIVTVGVGGQEVGNAQIIPNMISIFESGGDLRNDSDYIITLNDTEQDVLRLTLKAREIECGFIIYTAVFASYNGIEQSILENFSGSGQSIRVVR